MNDRLALRPDLAWCELEERILPAIEFGLFPNPFLLVNGATNQLFVPGTSTSSAGISAGGNVGGNSINLNGLGSSPPGPNWYFLMVGANASSVATGSTVGGSLSLYTFTNMRFLPTGALVHTISNLISPSGGGGGGGGGGAGSSSNSNSDSSGGGSAIAGGYGASFSSGYSFALGSGNNYGMFSSTGAVTTLGSVPVHTYSGGGEVTDSPEEQNGAEPGGGNGPNPAIPVPWGPAGTIPGYGVKGPASKLYENLLGKNLGQMGPKAVGPAAGMGGAADQGNP
jgi:hypothetical protein